MISIPSQNLTKTTVKRFKKKRHKPTRTKSVGVESTGSRGVNLLGGAVTDLAALGRPEPEPGREEGRE